MFVYYVDLAWRSFKRTPLVSILMICAIAVGIGITMTSLSVYHMMSSDPIPEKSDRLFSVQLSTMDEGHTWFTEDDLPRQLTYQDAMNLYNHEFVSEQTSAGPLKKTAMLRTGFSVHMNNDSLKPFIEGTRVTGRDFFSLFNLDFIYGGTWTKEQELSASQVVVISNELNQKLFGGQDSIGKEIMLDEHSFRIVGVTNDWDIHTKYYDLNNGAFNALENVFIPISLLPELEIPTWGNTNGWKFETINTYQERLASEVLWLQFWVQLDTPAQKDRYGQFLLNYLQDQRASGRFDRKDLSIGLRDVNEWIAYNGVVSNDNRILLGLSFMFLLVCLSNILGLLLGKFLRRAPEIGVRRALGASKTQIFLQHLVEVAILGLFGGLFGIVLAQLGLWGVRQTYDYYSAIASMDITMLLAAPTISILACVIAGLYPAWQVCKTTPAIYLKTQ